MIHKIKFTSGFPLEHKHMVDRTFQFTDGLNVLFGKNGCLKTVTLETIKAYCGVRKGGWSAISDPSTHGASQPSHFPFAYRAFTPGNCDAVVRWDGSPTFFNDGNLKIDNTFFWDNEKLSDDGITSKKEQLELLAKKPSSGQYRVHKMNRIMQIIKTPPNLSVVPDAISDKNGAMNEVNYIAGLSHSGKPTILLDEPERALSLPRQRDLFGVLEKLAENYQVIIATHSPLVFEISSNIIDMEDGYMLQCMEIIKDFAKKIKIPKKK